MAQEIDGNNKQHATDEGHAKLLTKKLDFNSSHEDAGMMVIPVKHSVDARVLYANMDRYQNALSSLGARTVKLYVDHNNEVVNGFAVSQDSFKIVKEKIDAYLSKQPPTQTFVR